MDERCELLVEEQEVIQLDPDSASRAYADSTDDARVFDGEDTIAFARKSRAQLWLAQSFDGARDDLTRRCSQLANKLSHAILIRTKGLGRDCRGISCFEEARSSRFQTISRLKRHEVSE